MNTFARTVLLAALLCSSCSLWAKGTYPVSDALSQVRDTQLPLKWRVLSPSRGDHQVEGVTQVHIKLDTRAWVGQVGRIYMALPAQPGGTISAQWSAQNATLQNGRITSGQRGLVWSGVVPSPLLEDIMTVTIQTDGRLLSANQLLRFYFEIDLQ
jgi:hypothetical protein